MEALSPNVASLPLSLQAMRNASLFILASAAAGYGVAGLAANRVTDLLLARYGHVLTSGAGNSALQWLGLAMLGSAAVAAVATPHSMKTTERRLEMGALVLVLSLIASISVAGMTLACASAPLVGGALMPADALAHATRWLFVGWLFAQVAVVGAWLVFRSHRDLELPRSTYSMQGYAALGRRPRVS